MYKQTAKTPVSIPLTDGLSTLTTHWFALHCCRRLDLLLSLYLYLILNSIEMKQQYDNLRVHVGREPTHTTAGMI